jgi:hypothetical protein
LGLLIQQLDKFQKQHFFTGKTKMETALYFTALKKYDQLPIGLEAYLGQALKVQEFKKKHRITTDRPVYTFLDCIMTGAARLYSTDNETHEEHTLDFFFEGDFLPIMPDTAPDPTSTLSIAFLEDTTTLSINERHYLFLPRFSHGSCTSTTASIKNIISTSYSGASSGKSFLPRCATNSYRCSGQNSQTGYPLQTWPLSSASTPIH